MYKNSYAKVSVLQKLFLASKMAKVSYYNLLFARPRLLIQRKTKILELESLRIKLFKIRIIVHKGFCYEKDQSLSYLI